METALSLLRYLHLCRDQPVAVNDSALQAVELLDDNDDGLLRQASAAAARAALALGDDQAAAELLDDFPGLLESASILSSSVSAGTPSDGDPHVVDPRSILATDASREVLDVARSKTYPEGRVRFEQADAYATPSLDAS